MEIIWVRHFMTPGNRKKQYIGSTDEPLDEEMIPQDLKDYPKIDALTVSPMLRCRLTAERIWPSMPFETEPLMRELDFGEYERKTYEELKIEPVYQAWLPVVQVHSLEEKTGKIFRSAAYREQRIWSAD